MTQHFLPEQHIQKAQDLIYHFLLQRVKNNSPQSTLLDFKHLFITCDDSASSEVVRALYDIVFNNEEEVFRNTLKRACYILVNNWASTRNYQTIGELIELLAAEHTSSDTLSLSLNRLTAWRINFSKSHDYQELKLFASPYHPQEKQYWSHRYTYYLLIPQYLDTSNSREQREIARAVTQKLKNKFKFDLAMYAARGDRLDPKEKENINPTKIGDDVIDLIKKIVRQHIRFSYKNYAHIFVEQIKDLNYQYFKRSLHKYLLFSISQKEYFGALSNRIEQKLESLYREKDSKNLDLDLLLRTCRRLIDFFTVEESDAPSNTFILLTTQGNPLTIVIILLKIILICQHARTHLDTRIAALIQHYEHLPEEECQWFINFLEIFNIVFAIYTDNVRYDLVQVQNQRSRDRDDFDPDAYRIFPQLKGIDLRETDLHGADLRSNDLNGADLRSANLSGADLSQANLNLARLSEANLNGAILSGAQLSIADLQRANLCGANLRNADLSRADLQEANLSGANLATAQLRLANLEAADLTQAILSKAQLKGAMPIGANFRDSDLQDANLETAHLAQANLSGANLTGANLTQANLSGANLTGANLTQANLSGANLTGANLTQANLSQANLAEVTLREANLSGALLRYATLQNACLSEANLSRADLSHADLSSSHLARTNLSDAFLRHVNLKDADLRGAILRGTNLFRTKLRYAKLDQARFRNNSGLMTGKIRELEQQGAVFEIDPMVGLDAGPSRVW